ncbi:MAG: hypothetical protein Ta2E_09010 [Mycoplasmoidaceae bacterium]|nr:MAG: hypothetical protein Ta2E_09010 [Mycoplasmoidaceae bacterium]
MSFEKPSIVSNWIVNCKMSLRIVFLGEQMTGKTSIIHRFVNGGSLHKIRQQFQAYLVPWKW